MYKIVSVRYESVIKKVLRGFAAQKIFCPPNHKSVPTALDFAEKLSKRVKLNNRNGTLNVLSYLEIFYFEYTEQL